MPNFVKLFPAVLLSAAVALVPYVGECCQAQDKPWEANAELVKKLSNNRGEFNYTEELVPHFSLPDPLVQANGEAVVAPDQWNKLRRPELLDIFRSQVYGHRPTTDRPPPDHRSTIA